MQDMQERSAADLPKQEKKGRTRPVTQKDIARRIGLDVSSCNKILHRVPGPVFRKETIDLVFRTAKEMGWDFDRYSKGWALAALREVYPETLSPEETARLRQIPLKRVLAIRKVLYTVRRQF